MKLKDRVIVVTGGASGIGEAMCRRFAQEKPKGIVVADINSDDASRVANDIDGHAVTVDVGKEQDISRLVRETEKKYGPIDLFCSNAGITSRADPLTSSLDIWQDQWQVNLMAHVYAMRAVLSGMLDRGEGYLLFTSSLAGILTSFGDLHYAVTKHAIVGLAEWLSITYHHRGVRVSCLCPGAVRTPMLDSDSSFAKSVAGPLHEPEKVADIVLDSITEERFLILTDPIAMDWMSRKTQDLERWLMGMRRLQIKIEEGMDLYKK
jgi:NAD(P)-dependent dehydrogenase (short-subunit alcohol dehydrogenase family)